MTRSLTKNSELKNNIIKTMALLGIEKLKTDKEENLFELRNRPKAKLKNSCSYG
jgi:hypothetical protein